VAEERHVGDAGCPRHLIDRDVVEPSLREETNRLELETLMGSLGSAHLGMLVTNIPMVESVEPFLEPMVGMHLPHRITS
jgi:hypothetical protein